MKTEMKEICGLSEIERKFEDAEGASTSRGGLGKSAMSNFLQKNRLKKTRSGDRKEQMLIIVK